MNLQANIHQLNARNGHFLTVLAHSGGIAAFQQIDQLARTPVSARHARKMLERDRLVEVLSPMGQSRSKILLLRPRCLEILGIKASIPARRSRVTNAVARNALTRVDYFLKSRRGLRPLKQFEEELKEAIKAHHAAELVRASDIREQMKQAPSQALARAHESIRREWRKSEDIVECTLPHLRKIFGLYLRVEKSSLLSFVYVDAGNGINKYNKIMDMVRTIAAASGLQARLEILCGSAYAASLVKEIVPSTDRVRVELVTLSTDVYFAHPTMLPSLISGNELGQQLGFSS